MLNRSEIVPADGLDEQRLARSDEVKRLGDHAEFLFGPYRIPADTAGAAPAPTSRNGEQVGA